MEGHQEGQEGLHHARAGEGRDDGLKHAGDEVDEGVQGELPPLSGGILRTALAGEELFHLLKNVLHMEADDHLEHPAALHHLGHALQGVQRGLVRLAVVRQVEAEAGLAVPRGGDVFRTAYALHHAGRQLLILLAHNLRTSFQVSKVVFLEEMRGFA